MIHVAFSEAAMLFGLFFSGIFKDVIGDKIIAFALKNVLVSTNVQSIINPAFRTLFCMGMNRLWSNVDGKLQLTIVRLSLFTEAKTN